MPVLPYVSQCFFLHYALLHLPQRVVAADTERLCDCRRQSRDEAFLGRRAALQGQPTMAEQMQRSSSLPDVTSPAQVTSKYTSSKSTSRPSSSSGQGSHGPQPQPNVIQLQARIDALEEQLSREQGRAFRASQEQGRLAGELDNLRSAKSDRMGIQGRLSTMADTLAGTHKDLIGAMQQRNAFKHLLKSILDAVEHFVSAASNDR